MAKGLQFRWINGAGERVFSVPCRGSDRLFIGRSTEENHVALNVKGVSRRHCQVFLDEGRICVEDLGSTNGTLHLGRRIEGKHYIQDGDQIIIGSATVEIRIEPEDAPPAEAPSQSPDEGCEDPTAPAAHATPRQAADNMAMTVVAPDSDGVEPATPHTARIDLVGDLLVIGRDAACDIHLDHVMISRRHAEFRRKGRAWLVRDLGSTNGTFVNGRRLRNAHPLESADILKIGPYELVFEGSHLVSRSLDKDGIHITVHKLSTVIENRSTSEPLFLLDDISLTIHPGEFVGLLGPSGCGKSTLMEAMNGRRPATSGDVYFNNVSIYQEFDAYKAQIGYVPQELIFHDALPLADALRYTSRLRLSRDVSNDEIQENIARVLAMVDLMDRRDTVIRQLSGGQKKRVSIASELLSKPSVLFLDEVTSGLDAHAEREMMRLFRDLSDAGVTVICTSHHLDNLYLCDKLVALMEGQLAFVGPHDHLLRHFEIPRLVDFFDLAGQRPPTEWRAAFERSPYWVGPERVGATIRTSESHQATRSWDTERFKSQLRILTKRYAQLVVLDKARIISLIAVAPAVTALVNLLASSIHYSTPLQTPSDYEAYTKQQGILAFGSIITVMFLAMFGAIQEIISDARVYRHERFVVLQVIPYVLSKIGPLAVVGAIQSLLVVGTMRLIGQLEIGGLLQQLLVLFSASLAGTTLGLAISAAVPDRSRGKNDGKNPAVVAVMIMNAFVIAQVLFSGAIVTLDGVVRCFAQLFVSSYWAYEAFLFWLSTKLPAGQLRTDEPHWLFSMAMVLLHAFVCAVLLFLAMMRKDGPGALRKLVRSIPRNEKGRIDAGQLIQEVRKLMHRT